MKDASVKIEWGISTSTTSSWVLINLLYSGTWHFLDFYLPLLLFSPLIILIGWMVHVHYIKFTFYIILGAPPPGNISLDFLTHHDSILLSTSTYLLFVPLTLVLVRLWVLLPPHPNLTVTRIEVLFSSNLDRRVFSARTLESLGSVLVHSILIPCCFTSQRSSEWVPLMRLLFLCTNHPSLF